MTLTLSFETLLHLAHGEPQTDHKQTTSSSLKSSLLGTPIQTIYIYCIIYIKAALTNF
jgi:hypothetical protein